MSGGGAGALSGCWSIAAKTTTRTAARTLEAASSPDRAPRRRPGSGLGRHRCVVERTFAWLHNLRRLRTRYERDDRLHLARMQLGCAVVCLRRLRPT
jgi:transposase